MQNCNNCDENFILKKLGRCRACLWQSLLLSVGCWLLWYWLNQHNAEYVQQVAALFGALFGSGLLLGHLLLGIYYRLKGQDGVFSAPTQPQK